MERNTFLAIALSFVIFFVYQSIFPPPKPPKVISNVQANAAQGLSEKNTLADSVAINNPQETTTMIEKSTDYIVKNPKETVSYSKVGGSLHKIDFTGNMPFPLTDVLSINGLDDVPYSGQQLNDNTVSFTYKNKDWQITKTYDSTDNHLIKVRLEIKNISEMSNLNDFNFTAFEIDQTRMDISNARYNGLFEYSVDTNHGLLRRDNAYKFSDKDNKSGADLVKWIGFRDRYNAVIVKPEFETKSFDIKEDTDQRLSVSLSPQAQHVRAGESVVYNFDIYAGPQSPWIMNKYDSSFEKIIVFSKHFIFNWPAQIIYRMLPFLHKIFHSWGVAIILVSIMLYAMTYPLTLQSMKSMRKMQEVQPKMAALKERYKNDAQKLQMETMEIYRREKINPLSGCLPFLIQMPFFGALYQVLWRAQYFQGQSFLWIRDLSQPDRLMTFQYHPFYLDPFHLIYVDNELNILPILTGALMFLQQKVSSKSMAATDEQQVMQQKMMMYLMPVMMTLVFYRFASSWAIYFVVYYILSTLTQWKISKMAVKK